MSAWQPSDDELDALARGLPAHDPKPQRSEQTRTTLLANAAATKQVARASRGPIIAAVAVPLAAAAAIAIWLGTRPTEPSAKDTLTAHDAARYAALHAWPDRIVRLDDGALSVELRPLAEGERFRIQIPDGEVEAREARFVVAVRGAHVDSVAVASGRVELRVVDAQTVFLSAGQSWSRTVTARRDDLIVTPPPPAPPAQPVTTPPRAREPQRRIGVAPREPQRAEVAATPPTPPPTPGEAEFRAGVIALRTGDAGAAAAAFATACSSAQAALAEDACFWVGAAARRAGQTATARDALARFLQRFPTSARAGEASALLGWVLFESGDLTGAAQRFERAAGDRVPKVRESAAKGMQAIERTRGSK
jgi:hypothetical protein